MTDLWRDWKPILVLMVLAPFLAEVGSGAIPITMFFLPGYLLPYMIFLYGVQILVIREVAVRRNIGLVGLWCLGLVYGIYNEALLAETLFAPLTSPLETFADYGLVANLRVPFTVWILAWHGLFSVLTPVLVVQRLFPDRAARPWLPVRLTWVLGTLSIAFAVTHFLMGEDRQVQDGSTFAIHLALVVAAAVAVCAVAMKAAPARRVAGLDQSPGSLWQPFTVGAALYAVLFVGTEVLADSAVPWLLFMVFFLLILIVALWAVGRAPAVALDTAVAFVLGAGAGQSVLGIVFGIVIGQILWAVAGLLFTAAIAVMLIRLRRSRRALPHGSAP